MFEKCLAVFEMKLYQFPFFLEFQKVAAALGRKIQIIVTLLLALRPYAVCQSLTVKVVFPVSS